MFQSFFSFLFQRVSNMPCIRNLLPFFREILLPCILSASLSPSRFAVFVLLKIGTEIYDTVMVNPVDRSMTDICFDDIIVL